MTKLEEYELIKQSYGDLQTKYSQLRSIYKDLERVTNEHKKENQELKSQIKAFVPILGRLYMKKERLIVDAKISP